MGNRALVPLELYTSGSNPTVPTPPEGAIYYNSTSNEIRMYNGTTWYASVNTETTQSIGGAKTFTSAVTAPSLTVSLTNYDTYFDPDTIGIFVTGGADAGASWDVGTTSNRMWMRLRPSSATAGSQTRSTWIRLGTNRWTGAASSGEDVEMWGRRVSDTVGDYKFALDFASVEKFSVDSTGIVTAASYFSAPAATTAIPSIRLPHGAAPSSPTNGDIWTTTAGMYVRINGTTVGPLAAAGGVSYATTSELANVDNAAESAGASALVARGDHKHAVNSATAIALTGSAGAGTSTSLALADHQHGTSGLVLTTTDQSIAGVKTFTGNISSDAITATVGSQANDTPYLRFKTTRWTGAASADEAFTIQAVRDGVATAGSYRLTLKNAAGTEIAYFNPSGNFQVDGQVQANNMLADNGGNYVNVAPSSTLTSTILTFEHTTGTYLTMSQDGRFQIYDNVDMTEKGRLIVGGTNGARTKAVGANGTVLTADSADARGVTWVDNLTPIIFSVNGQLGVAAGVARIGVEGNYTIKGVRARVDTAPTGTSIKVDVNKNGTTLWSTQTNRPDIAVSTNASSYVTNMNTTTLASGDYLTVDVDQIGSTIAGSHLTVTVWLVRTS